MHKKSDLHIFAAEVDSQVQSKLKKDIFDAFISDASCVTVSTSLEFHKKRREKAKSNKQERKEGGI